MDDEKVDLNKINQTLDKLKNDLNKLDEWNLYLNIRNEIITSYDGEIKYELKDMNIDELKMVNTEILIIINNHGNSIHLHIIYNYIQNKINNKMIEEMWYAPGMPGFIQSKQHFNNIKSDVKDDK